MEIQIKEIMVSCNWSIHYQRLGSCTILSCVQTITGSHTGLNIATVLHQIVADFTTRVTAATTDNASNMKAALVERNYPFVPCATHTIQLSIKNMVKKHLPELMTNLHQIVNHFAHSSPHHDRLLELQQLLYKEKSKNLGLLIDVETRFDSTTIMLARILELQQILQLLIMELALPQISSKDWSSIEYLVVVGKVIEKYSTLLGGEGYLTASLVWPTVRMLRWSIKATVIPSSGHVTELLAFKTELLQDIAERWDNIAPVLKLSTYLDPRFKHLSWASNSTITEVKRFAVEKFQEEVKFIEQQEQISAIEAQDPNNNYESPSSKKISNLF